MNAGSVLWIMKCTLHFFFFLFPFPSPYDGWHRRLQVFRGIISCESAYLRQPAVQRILCQTQSYYTARTVEQNRKGKKRKGRKKKIWKRQSRDLSRPGRGAGCLHWPCDSRCEKTIEGQSRDLSISLSTSDLILSLSAEGVASFICLHNCRPACQSGWHMLATSTTRSLPKQRRLR